MSCTNKAEIDFKKMNTWENKGTNESTMNESAPKTEISQALHSGIFSQVLTVYKNLHC